MNSQLLLVKIATYLARFTAEVKGLNEANLYDINIHAENVLIPLLNEVFSLSLQNANVQAKNYPAIDLIDPDNRVAIQVTATADSQKITDTLTMFTKNNQYKAFDHLYIYIISERQKSYMKNFSALLENKIEFDSEKHIIDNSKLERIIKDQIPSVQRLIKIERILSEEFSEQKIELRSGSLSGLKADTTIESIYPNLLKMRIPQVLYIGKIGINIAENKKELVEQFRGAKKFKQLRHITPKWAVSHYLKKTGVERFDDYLISSDLILTFRDLTRSNEPLRKVVDIGTIEQFTPNDYVGENTDRENIFKSLLSETLRQDLFKRNIEWVGEEKVFRFTSGKIAKVTKVTWVKDKNKATREVISEIWSKPKEEIVVEEDGKQRTRQERHIICFRHLAFTEQMHLFNDEWYISIKPTWSFTSDGHSQSRFTSNYMTGIKKLENNEAVYNHFRFIGSYLGAASGNDLYYTFKIQFESPQNFNSSPAIDDDSWKKSEPKEGKIENQFEIDSFK